MQNNKLAYRVGILICLAIVLLGFTGLSLWAVTGVLFFSYILINLLFGFGEGIPVNLVIGFIASLQWIIGPVLSYYTGINHPFYGMNIPEEVYFSYIIPGTFLYYIGLSLPIFSAQQISLSQVEKLEDSTTSKTKGAYYLLAVGFAASLLSSFVPPVLYFFLYLLSQLKYIGAFYLYLSKSGNKTVLYVVFAFLLLEVLASAIFHDLVLWGLFFIFIYTIKNYVSMPKKLTYLALGFFMLLVLQTVKYQYRNVAWTNASLGSLARSELFTTMVFSTLLSPESMFEQKRNENTITRLNQGWIIARVMNYVPYNQPFAGGETIGNAFAASLLPRFIADSKATAGGRENMLRFTGIELQYGTSMNISIIGEAYANYGRTGGIAFMFFIGMLFSFILRFILIKSRDNPTLILWIPFLFLQVIKAETDLITTLNYLVKASIAMFIVFWSFRNILKVEI
ncbi:hypothetical protein JAO76_16475 [Pontibacter sp. BT310]|uniref:O-antigen polysaccharide polymerase Wzy n=1 Tax=Pontibacter populi TaxID=890055 RepID=A0ABS6XFA3_9BACT|nr:MULTISPECIES: hypothetical protein [Pontibacter]MBJ6119805.1 hypothetical protein [Pontibacter sp. BT310]MBR0572234.1 hypothetical protein [Microvirga sp. STS03]MBW3366658.1 hypothetical protein [Pontibacter populi]